MQGVVFNGNRQAEIRQFPDPHAGPGEAVVKVRASGLCGSDLHRYRDTEPTETISGHEPCGVVAELGAGAPSGLQVGDRVIVHHYRGCGICEICAMGYEQLCPEGNVVYGGGSGHGSNADYILVPSRTLVRLPNELSFEEGTPRISCGTGTAWNGLRKMELGAHVNSRPGRGGRLWAGLPGPERHAVGQGHGFPGQASVPLRRGINFTRERGPN